MTSRVTIVINDKYNKGLTFVLGHLVTDERFVNCCTRAPYFSPLGGNGPTNVMHRLTARLLDQPTPRDNVSPSSAISRSLLFSRTPIFHDSRFNRTRDQMFSHTDQQNLA